MLTFNQQFAAQYALNLNSVHNFARLGRKYAEESTKACNGDHFLGCGGDKSKASMQWQIQAEATGKRMEAIIQKWGFHHLDFGVGMHPTIQDTESDSTRSIIFDYTENELDKAPTVAYRCVVWKPIIQASNRNSSNTSDGAQFRFEKDADAYLIDNRRKGGATVVVRKIENPTFCHNSLEEYYNFGKLTLAQMEVFRKRYELNRYK